jgi:hypothetical protein
LFFHRSDERSLPFFHTVRRNGEVHLLLTFASG